MIFNHKVKHNGITYPAGTDVPVEDKQPKSVPTAEVEKEEPKPVKTTTKSKKMKK